MRTVYVNGEFVPEDEAKISVFDRGFLFADAVYEVTAILNGKLVDNDGHLTRLERSLNELDMKSPVTNEQLVELQHRLAEKNNLTEGFIYLQVSRGAEDRDFNYGEDLQPSLVMFTQAKSIIDTPKSRTGIKVKTVEDIRWQRRDIKTTMLLAQSLAKKQAVKESYDDAWMVEDGIVTEGSSNNAYIITHNNEIYTRPASNKILNGITRRAVNKLAEQNNLKVIEKTFTVNQAKQAKEVFATSASYFVMPVVNIDGITLGDGKPGKLTLKLRDFYINMAKSSGSTIRSEKT